MKPFAVKNGTLNHLIEDGAFSSTRKCKEGSLRSLCQIIKHLPKLFSSCVRVRVCVDICSVTFLPPLLLLKYMITIWLMKVKTKKSVKENPVSLHFVPDRKTLHSFCGQINASKSELATKWRHENKFYADNQKQDRSIHTPSMSQFKLFGYSLMIASRVKLELL